MSHFDWFIFENVVDEDEGVHDLSFIGNGGLRSIFYVNSFIDYFFQVVLILLFLIFKNGWLVVSH